MQVTLTADATQDESGAYATYIINFRWRDFMNIQLRVRNLNRAVFAAMLAGGVVAYPSAAAAGTDKAYEEQAKATARQTQNPADTITNKKGPELAQIDDNNDQNLGWSEIDAIFDAEIDEAGWTEGYVFENYDKDEDALLNEDEYMKFVAALISETAVQADPSSAELDVSVGGDRQKNAGAEQVRINEMSAADGENSDAIEQATGREASAQSKGAGQVGVADLAKDEIEERTVVNAAGEVLGQVEKVVTAPDGSISGIVVAVGGFWDIGSKDIFVPVDQAYKKHDQITWDTQLTEQELDKMPRYKIEEYTTVIPEE